MNKWLQLFGVAILLYTVWLLLWWERWRKERRRKWAEVQAYWDELATCEDPSTVAIPAWLQELEQ